MSKMQGCVDCNNFAYSFDIELVDELDLPVSDIDYEILLEKNNFVLAKGKTDGKGKISVEGIPLLPLRLVLDTDLLLKEMQATKRHLRLGRT